MKGLFFITATILGIAVTPANAELKGDRAAIALAEKMIERLGGAETWSESRTLYLEYDGWRGDSSQPVMERAWRDLAEPNQRMIFESRRAEAVFNMTAEASWITHSERDTIIHDAEQHQENLAFWDFDFYTIIHNLARGDDRITLALEEPQTIRISGPGGADWGWFEIDQTGQPIRWGAPDGEDDTLEYIYGPVRAFGNINFPAWGTARDGFWRFEYKTVDVSRHPLDIELTPPGE